MSTRVERGASEIVVGEWPAHPEHTAVLEARGALLAWDVLVDSGPAARIHDLALAAEWLWEVYGPEAAAGILGGATEVEPSADDWVGRVAAYLSWAEAWWPASAVAGVPALDPAVLSAERAVALAEVEHVLDDPDAVARALSSLSSLSSSESADPAVLALMVTVAELAEDYGVVLPEAVAPRQSQFALAAGIGARGDGVIVLSGSNAVDWALVPAGVVDAGALAEWTVARRQGGTFLDVAVVPAPGLSTWPRLSARLGQFDVPLDGTDDLGRFVGSASVPPTVLLLPPARRVLTVYAPDFADPLVSSDPDTPARRAAIIAHAQARVGAATSTLTERLAGSR
ncbi:hypothetical protein [Actinokineospora sp. NBRC 105648]|uniref:hypothetical protein n=1 Tax=Actinokineospora sp. NBRC 105648 TaxID=3032206 RepID=UPI00249FE443|nr:hypothetical protein [Actinokineospora sp. NBRC 105648]GLZ37798.1 hypothetical protein Acsp05_14230 [Actinokineospora sp. NBRC 105648]